MVRIGIRFVAIMFGHLSAICKIFGKKKLSDIASDTRQESPTCFACIDVLGPMKRIACNRRGRAVKLVLASSGFRHGSVLWQKVREP